MYNLRIKPSLALASFALAGASLVAAGGQALAAEETVTFSGTVGATCTLDNVVPGTLYVNSAVPGILAPTNDSFGYVDVECTGPAQILVSAVTMTTAPAGFIPHQNSPEAHLHASGGRHSIFRAGVTENVITTTGPISETLRMNFGISQPDVYAPLPNGNYAAAATVTANPL